MPRPPIHQLAFALAFATLAALATGLAARAQEAQGTNAGEALLRLCEWLEAEARPSRSL